MPVCALPNVDGFLAVVPEVEMELCTGYVMVTSQEYDNLMQYTQVTPEEISQAFGFGFALVFVGGYLSTYAVQIAQKVIKTL